MIPFVVHYILSFSICVFSYQANFNVFCLVRHLDQCLPNTDNSKESKRGLLMQCQPARFALSSVSLILVNVSTAHLVSLPRTPQNHHWLFPSMTPHIHAAASSPTKTLLLKHSPIPTLITPLLTTLATIAPMQGIIIFSRHLKIKPKVLRKVHKSIALGKHK